MVKSLSTLYQLRRIDLAESSRAQGGCTYILSECHPRGEYARSQAQTTLLFVVADDVVRQRRRCDHRPQLDEVRRRENRWSAARNQNKRGAPKAALSPAPSRSRYLPAISIASSKSPSSPFWCRCLCWRRLLPLTAEGCFTATCK